MFLDDEIEVLRPDLPRGRFRSVLFDFDGTLSLIREGWPAVMIPMMVEVLQGTGTRETAEELTAVVEDFVMRLNGRQTIYQMMQLADEVRKRGGTPQPPRCARASACRSWARCSRRPPRSRRSRCSRRPPTSSPWAPTTSPSPPWGSAAPTSRSGRPRPRTLTCCS